MKPKRIKRLIMMDLSQALSDVQTIKEWETVPMVLTIVPVGLRALQTLFLIVIALTTMELKCLTILRVQAQ